MKQNLLILGVALLALAGGLTAKKIIDNPATNTAEAKLDFTLPDIDGKPHNIAEWQGKALIINFWATWCPPCLKEIPEFIQLQAQLAEKNVQFIGIAIEDPEPVAEFLQKSPINYPILIGGDAGISLSQQLGNVIGAVPFTVIVDQQGQIIHRHPGELSREKLLEVLQPLID